MLRTYSIHCKNAKKLYVWGNMNSIAIFKYRFILENFYNDNNFICVCVCVCRFC